MTRFHYHSTLFRDRSLLLFIEGFVLFLSLFRRQLQLPSSSQPTSPFSQSFLMLSLALWTAQYHDILIFSFPWLLFQLYHPTHERFLLNPDALQDNIASPRWMDAVRGNHHLESRWVIAKQPGSWWTYIDLFGLADGWQCQPGSTTAGLLSIEHLLPRPASHAAASLVVIVNVA